MIDAVLVVLDVAVEHGGIRLQPDFVGSARDLEPVVAVDFVIADDMPDAIGENLSSAAGHGIESRLFEFDQYLARRHFADLGEEGDLDHGERLEVYLREAFFQAGDEIDVVLERQVGMQAADDVKLGDGFGVTGAGRGPDFLQRHGVRAGNVFLAAEGAQAASGHADVRVVDVAIDVEVGEVAVHPLAHMIGQPADR